MLTKGKKDRRASLISVHLFLLGLWSEKRNGNYNFDEHVLVGVNVKNESFLGFFLS